MKPPRYANPFLLAVVLSLSISSLAQQSTEIVGRSKEGTAVSGSSGNVGAEALNTNGNKAYLGARCCAGDFYGTLYVHGDLQVQGAKHFVIDHPLDPENRYLYHASVLSSEKNYYDGLVTLDKHGQAIVNLPEWFESLNKDFRYQITAIGGPEPNLYIAEEITNNQFRIAGGKKGKKVSWAVSGNRRDAWATANPMSVEIEKPIGERGLYLNPELSRKPPGKGIEHARYAERTRSRDVSEIAHESQMNCSFSKARFETSCRS